ncbi:hypothetical protein ACWCQQ_41685, partial [Streptomyces sp. NPDC002143]
GHDQSGQGRVRPGGEHAGQPGAGVWERHDKVNPDPGGTDQYAAPSKAERAAYAVLLHGPAARSDGADASQWLLDLPREVKELRQTRRDVVGQAPGMSAKTSGGNTGLVVAGDQ